MKNHKQFLEEFERLGEAQELAIFLVNNLPITFEPTRLPVTSGAMYCHINVNTFRRVYHGERKRLAMYNYRKLVIGWLSLKIELLKKNGK